MHSMTNDSTHSAGVSQIKYFFGALGLFTALLLWLPRTRRLGFFSAIVVTVAGRVFPALAVDRPEEIHLGAAMTVISLAGLGMILLS